MPILRTNQFTFKYMDPADRRQPVEHLLVGMHGLGDSYHGYTWLPDAVALPGLGFLLLNAPDAYMGGYSWYNFPENTGDGIRRSRQKLFAAIEELGEQGFPSRRLLLFGFSQGAVMALDAALRYPGEFLGVVGVSGYVASINEYPGALGPYAPRQKILTTHGTMDPLVPFGRSESQYQALREMGVAVEFHPYTKEHTILPDEIRDVRSWIASRIPGPVAGGGSVQKT